MLFKSIQIFEFRLSFNGFRDLIFGDLILFTNDLFVESNSNNHENDDNNDYEDNRNIAGDIRIRSIVLCRLSLILVSELYNDFRLLLFFLAFISAKSAKVEDISALDLA